MNIKELGEFVPDGRMVHIKFVSRTDHKEHEVVGRVGVQKHVTGEGLKFNPFSRNLLPVYSFKRDSKGRFLPYGSSGYRMVPAEGVIEIKSDGVIWHKKI